MKISVVIPTYNSWATLKECILSIQKQTLKPAEVIVVDNASSDATSQKVKLMFPEIKLITLTENTGVTGGRNRGIEEASIKSDYVLFFDHDMVADRKMLAELIKTAQSNDEIGIVTPKIYYSDDKKRIWAAGTGINLWTGQVLFRGGRDTGQYEREEEVQVAPAVLLVKRNVISKLKSFDNIYFATYEDTDFCFRAKRLGYKTLYAPKGRAFHEIPSNREKEAKRLLSRAYWVGRNRVIFMRRFSKNFLISSLFIPIFILYYLNLALKFKRFKDWLNFLRGTIEGYLGFSLGEKKIPFSYINLIRKSIGDKVSTILDLGCGDGSLIKALSEDEDWEVVGVDANKESIEIAKTIPAYKTVILGDIENVAEGLILSKKKFDVVLCSQVFEHLPKDKGKRLLDLLNKLALRRIVISSPNGFMEQIEESLIKDNPYQEHISGWSIEDFSGLGYVVRGIGSKWIWSCSGLARSRNKFIAIFFRFISFILSPIIYYLPIFSINLLAVKSKHIN